MRTQSNRFSFRVRQEEYEDYNATGKDQNVAKADPAPDDAKNEIAGKETKPTADAKPRSDLLDSNICDLLGLSTNEKVNDKTEPDCLLDWFDEIDSRSLNLLPSNPPATASDDSSFDLFKKIQGSAPNTAADKEKSKPPSKSKTNEKKNSAWMDLFADLDPLANPANMEKKISGPNQNCLDA